MVKALVRDGEDLGVIFILMHASCMTLGKSLEAAFSTVTSSFGCLIFGWLT